MAKKVVYTCIAGTYDDLKKHAFRHPDFDYVCFTDIEDLLNKKSYYGWDIRPLAFNGGNNTLNARWHKTHPHILFPDYAESVWTDGTINILTDHLFQIFDQSELIATPKHFERTCIYQECDAVAFFKHDTEKNVNRVRAFLDYQKMPSHYGLAETNIIFRRHNLPQMIDLDEQWWEMIDTFSKRDQLSFTYIMWKNGIKFDDITFPNERLIGTNYRVERHQSELTEPRKSTFFSKEIVHKNRVHIKLCGIKILSYIPKTKKGGGQPRRALTRIPDLLIYTAANEKYWDFAILYPLFALQANPDASVEIGIIGGDEFFNRYHRLIEFYNQNYPNQVVFNPIQSPRKILPNSVRFVVAPASRARYVYIGDIDILITQPILALHLKNITDNNLDFSNIKRVGQEKLSGLHFIEYAKMFPEKSDIPRHWDLEMMNDENLLLQLMMRRGFKIPDETRHTFRPLHGLHASYYSRAPLPTRTTGDDIVAYPSWAKNIDNSINTCFAREYLAIRYTPMIKNFMAQIDETMISLRQKVQVIDMFSDYLTRHYD